VYTRDYSSSSWHNIKLEAGNSTAKDYFGIKVNISPDESSITVVSGVYVRSWSVLLGSISSY
jgi:hypothetical protein